jgi:hypothetical protein
LFRQTSWHHCHLLTHSFSFSCAFEALYSVALSVFVRSLLSSFNICESTHGHLDKVLAASRLSSRPSLFTPVQISLPPKTATH